MTCSARARHLVASATILLGMTLPVCVEACGKSASVSVGPGAPTIPVYLFAGEPRGPYGTGTFELSWVEERRSSVETRGTTDDRQITVQVWYPASIEKDAPGAPYVLSPERFLEKSRESRWSDWQAQLDWPDAVRYVCTNSVIDAPMAGAGERYPVLIYSHGAGQAQFTATFHAEFLASHGYVFVAIGHPGFNGVRFPRQSMSRLSDVPRKQMSPRELAEWRWRYDPLSSVGVPEGIENISFVLNQLERANVDPRHRLYQRLDLERVGALGFSWGGSVSLQAALDDPRVKAVINEDGGPWGLLGERGAVARGVSCPVMIMSNSEDWPATSSPEGTVTAAEQEMKNAMALHYWELLRRSAKNWYWVRLANSSHIDFSDRPLFEPGAGAGAPAHIHPRLAHAIINHYALEFFDKYLRGREGGPLLSGTGRYFDASLQRSEGRE